MTLCTQNIDFRPVYALIVEKLLFYTMSSFKLKRKDPKTYPAGTPDSFSYFR